MSAQPIPYVNLAGSYFIADGRPAPFGIILLRDLNALIDRTGGIVSDGVSNASVTATGGATNILADWMAELEDVAAIVADGDKGDITVSASGATWTIDPGVVTLAKQADVASGSVFYRKTAGSGAPEVQTLATLKTDLALVQADIGGLTTADSPQFAAINIGHASDTTLARSSAGTLTVEGNELYRAGGTDVPLTDGGTGASTAAGARTNLGLGTAAVKDTGTSGANVPLLNGTNTWSSPQTITPATFGLGNITALTLNETWQDVLNTYQMLSINGTSAANASASSTLIDCKVDTVSQFKVSKAGAVTGNSFAIIGGGAVYSAGGTDVAVADGGTGSSTAAGAATNLGLGTGDSPQFTAINLGHASDTTLTRVSAGDVAIEGNTVYRAGGTDVPVADGGTGASTAAGARTNLGLGTAAVKDTGTSGATVPLLDGANTFSATTTFSVGGSTDSKIGATSNYNVHSLNNSLALNGSLGMFGGASGDASALYLSSPATVRCYIAGVEYHRFTTGGANILNSVATPAGGTAGAGVTFGSTSNFGVFFGSGAPTLAAAKGSLYLRSDGSGTNNRMYVNTDGSTTWTAVVTVA